jgi:hypothetical protein
MKDRSPHRALNVCRLTLLEAVDPIVKQQDLDHSGLTLSDPATLVSTPPFRGFANTAQRWENFYLSEKDFFS